MNNDNKLRPNHWALYEEVQESFVDNLVKAIRVAGGISTETGKLENISKGELAGMSNLSKGTVTKLTSSDPQDAKPDLETLCKIGHALNISPAFLMMTPRDWSRLIQAFSTLGMLTNKNGEHEVRLVQVLNDAANCQKVDEAAKAGLAFMHQLNGDDYSTEERARQQMGILAMTAIAQASVKRQGSSIKMFATGLGAILGDREITPMLTNSNPGDSQ